VRAYPEGPLIVRGDVRIEDEAGTAIATGAIVALCRCGRSRIPPLCDGLHAVGGDPACDRRAEIQRGQSSS
jgi:CDGSH-type Zn-finger protein